MLFLSQSSTLKSRNGSEWRAYCNLNDLGQSSSFLPWHTAYILNLWCRCFKGRDTCVNSTSLISAPAWTQLPCYEWRWTRGFLLDTTFALILIRYAGGKEEAVVLRWTEVTVSSLALFHFHLWQIPPWWLTLGQILHSWGLDYRKLTVKEK